MHARNDNIELISRHQTGRWLVPARLPPGLLRALADRRKITLHDKIARVIVSMLMVPALAASRGAT